MSKNSDRVKRWRLKHKKLCPDCQIKYIRADSLTCLSCSKSLGDLTLNDAIYKNNHRSSAFALIRNRARRMYDNVINGGCKICGYSKHVEVCHIKPISKFDGECKISEINSENNIVILCPNHHWEFDNNLIKF